MRLISFARMFLRLADTTTRFFQTLWGKAFLAAGIILFIVIESRGRNDLDIFLSASVDLFSGKNIYTALYFEGYHYYYSLFFASLIRPLAEIPAWMSKSVWIIFNLFLLWRMWKITWFFLGEKFKDARYKYLFGLILLLVGVRFIRGNLHLCQMTIIMLGLSLEAVYRATRKQEIAAGVLLAVAINIKLLPLVLIPYFIYRTRWKVAVYCFGFLAILYLAPALWLGWENNSFLVKEWWALVNPAREKHILDVDETSFHSLSTLFATLTIEDLPEHDALPLKRNILCLSIPQLEHLILAVRMFFILFTLWFLRSLPFKETKSRIHQWWELSYLLLIIPLIFPHQQHYAFLFAMPAMAYLLHWLIIHKKENQRRKYLLVLTSFLVISIVFNLSLWLGAYKELYDHFKILTYGALLLVIVLATLVPEKEVRVLNQ